MELSRRTIQRMILRKSGDTTVINQGSEGGGGGSQPSVALGPLLTSLNSEAMPSAEGYIHWTGSAWAFDTPTGGDPVDLTPYALKTWVQDNFAYKNDLVNFITRTEAESEFAPISHTHDNYLPLSAGANKALTDSLYITGSNGIQWAGSPGVGMLCYMPSSGWTGISASQWGVGAPSAQGVIRTNSNDILHYRNGTNYKIWDAYNFTPSDYLLLTGGTVESLTVTNGLDADAITVGSIVNSDTLAEYLDQDASDARYLQLTGGTLTGNLIMNGAGVGFGPNGNYGYIDYSNSQLRIGSEAVHVQSDGLFLFNGDQVATQPWVTAQIGNYLPLAGGTVSGNLTMVGGSIYFKRTSRGNVDGAILARTVTPPGYQSAVGCITIGGAVNFDNDGAPPMVAGKWLATQEWVQSQYTSLFTQLANYDGAVQITIGGTQKSLTIAYASTAGSANTAVNADKLDNHHADDFALASSLGNYLPLTGGTVNGNLNVKGTIQAQDSNGNNKVIIYGTTGNIRAEKVYIGGSTSGYEAATHDWVTGQGYQANIIESVKVNGTALTPTNKAVDIPAATSDGVIFGVVAIGTGFTFDEGRLCVDTSTFATRTWADGRYLPLSAGPNKALTGSLYITGSNGIQWAGSPGVGMLCYMPSSGWTGISASQWGVGATSAQGVIRSNANDILHYRNGTNYKIWDAYNFTPSDYLPLAGGTVESLTVTNGLDADSITVSSLVNSDTLSEYLDQDASDARYLQLTGGSSHPLTGELFINKSATASATSDVALAIANNWARTDIKDKSIGITIGASSDYYFTKIATVFESQNPDYLRPALAFYTMDSTAAAGTEVERMRIAANGNVGIGTNSPIYKLDVRGNVSIGNPGGFGKIGCQYSASNTDLYNYIALTSADSNGDIVYQAGGWTASDHVAHLFKVQGSSTALVIRNNGNVGIGTTSPAYNLDVNGNTGVTGSLDVSIELSVGDVTNGGVWLSDSALGVWTMSGTSRQETELMSLVSGGVTFSGDTIMTGKLAVGTTAFDGSNAKLQVGGNMFATGSITSKSNAGNVTLGNGNISATNLYISTIVFGNSNNDPAIYIGNGHVYARNSQGQTTMIV